MGQTVEELFKQYCAEQIKRVNAGIPPKGCPTEEVVEDEADHKERLVSIPAVVPERDSVDASPQRSLAAQWFWNELYGRFNRIDREYLRGWYCLERKRP